MRQRHRLLVVRLNLASVLGLAVCAVAACASATHSGSKLPSPVITNSVVRAGSKSVSYHGVSITVPSSYGVGPLVCTSPTSDWVLPFTNEAASCPAMRSSPDTHPGTPTFTVVSLATITFDSTLAKIATVPVTVNGIAARQGEGTPSEYEPRTFVLALEQPGVLISITAPTAADAQSIFNTVHLAPVDQLGCRAHIADFQPTGNASASEIIPSGATRAVVCEYAALDEQHGYWLVGSLRLTPAQLSAMPAEVNDLPTSTGPDESLMSNVPFEWYQLTYRHTTRTIASTLDIDPTTVFDGEHDVTADDPGPLPTAFAN